MLTIEARNVNDAFTMGVRLIQGRGVRNTSRNGDVLMFPHPVVTVYSRPRERVLFHSLRKANHFFHFFESLWMLAGRNDLDFLVYFNPRMAEYSDDGLMIRGSAYGYRWRNYFTQNQIEAAIRMLKISPDSRRVVISHWDPNTDLAANSKDVPCNTQIYVNLHRGLLDITVVNRSNDMIWGAYGSNAVHFSMLQEYLAMKLGVEVGKYYQFSNNLHVYLDNDVWKRVQYAEQEFTPVYAHGAPVNFSTQDPNDFDKDLSQFFRDYDSKTPMTDKNYKTPYFKLVVLPMFRAWAHKSTDPVKAMQEIQLCMAPDWRSACSEYLKPSYTKALKNGQQPDVGVHEEMAEREGTTLPHLESN